MTQCVHCGREASSIAGSGAPICADCAAQQQFRVQPATTPALSPQKISYSDWLMSLTGVLVSINLLIYALMTIKGVPFLHPSSPDVVRWGANFGPLTLGGQWWRLLTSAFVHIGILHLAFNMWALLNVGRLAEAIYGWRTYLAIYLGSAIAGSLGSLSLNSLAVSAGASGAIFGISGALITSLYLGHVPLPKRSAAPILQSLVIFAGYNLVFGFVERGIDQGAHVGGLVFGLAMGAGMGHHLGLAPHARRFRRMMLAAGLVVLIAFGMFVYRANGYVAQIETARLNIARGNYGEAIPVLQRLNSRRPNDPEIYAMLGNVYLQQGQMEDAENSFKRLATLLPAETQPLISLGQVYSVQQKWPEALDAYTKATQVGPKDATTWYDQGFVLQKLDKHAEAMAAFQKAVDIIPNLSPGWYALGISAMNVKKFSDAVHAFEQAAKSKPQDPDIQTWLANAFEANGQHQDSLVAFQRAFELRAAMKQKSQLRR